MDSFLQMPSQFRYLELLVPVGLKRRESHGVVASVSRAPHQLQHWRMRTTHLVAFRSSGATNRFSLLASIIFDHELNELAPQTGAGYLRRSFSTMNSKNWRHKLFRVGTRTGRFVVRDSGPFVMFCGQKHFAMGRFVARTFLCTGHSVSGLSCTQAIWLQCAT